jgi:hypothetical protein
MRLRRFDALEIPAPFPMAAAAKAKTKIYPFQKTFYGIDKGVRVEN